MIEGIYAGALLTANLRNLQDVLSRFISNHIPETVKALYEYSPRELTSDALDMIRFSSVTELSFFRHLEGRCPPSWSVQLKLVQILATMSGPNVQLETI